MPQQGKGTEWVGQGRLETSCCPPYTPTLLGVTYGLLGEVPGTSPRKASITADHAAEAGGILARAYLQGFRSATTHSNEEEEDGTGAGITHRAGIHGAVARQGGRVQHAQGPPLQPW